MSGSNTLQLKIVSKSGSVSGLVPLSATVDLGMHPSEVDPLDLLIIEREMIEIFERIWEVTVDSVVFSDREPATNLLMA